MIKKSPVLWIQTQDRLLSRDEFNVQRLIEFGPSPTLTVMANRTIKMKYEKQDLASNMAREIFCISKHSREIYYQFEDQPAEAASEPAATAAAPVAAAITVAPVAAAAPTSAAAVAVPDEPLKAVETLRALVAQGLKKPLSDVPLSKAIKDLVGGKSTLQNELLGSARKSSSHPSRCSFSVSLFKSPFFCLAY